MWCRYADDGICHCKTREQAEALLAELEQRFKECKLEIHPDKTKIIYCKVNSRNVSYQGNTSFVFLGYEFRTRAAQSSKTGKLFTSFLPAISPKAEKSITEKIKELNVKSRSDLSLIQIAEWLNPMIRGWINYYGKYTKTAMNDVLRRINTTLIRWSMKKFKKLRGRKTYATTVMLDQMKISPNLFAHWKVGVKSVFI